VTHVTEKHATALDPRSTQGRGFIPRHKPCLNGSLFRTASHDKLCRKL